MDQELADADACAPRDAACELQVAVLFFLK